MSYAACEKLRECSAEVSWLKKVPDDLTVLCSLQNTDSFVASFSFTQRLLFIIATLEITESDGGLTSS